MAFNTAYHGSLDTPIYIEYKKAKAISYHQHESYCIEQRNLTNILNDIEDFKLKCKDTMPENLFEFLDNKGMFGLQFVSCSS